MARFKFLPMRGRYVLASILLLAFTSVGLTGSTVQRWQPVGPAQYYLALGDSLTIGFQPNGDSTHGYVNFYFRNLQNYGIHNHLNLGCSRETSESFIKGGVCSYPSPQASQLANALAYLRAHPGHVSPIILSIGANDLLAYANLSTGNIDLNQLTIDLRTLDANITNILRTLHEALTINGQVTGDLIVLNYYNPFQNISPATIPVIQIINQHLAHDVQEFGILVDVFTAFGGTKTPNPNICKYTWMCSNPPTGPDIHPTTTGYQIIASAIEEHTGY